MGAGFEGARRGWVFDIQRFSTHDGPGIRTTVFLSGCGMRCKWCHNPESWSAGRSMIAYPDLCIGCRRCIGVCPTGARALAEHGPHLDRDLCTACGRCAEACPAEAVRTAGEERTAESVVEEVLRDRAFYEVSGGGVTLSGGEPLAQPEFAAAILAACAAEGIDTAVETAGFVPWSAFDTVAPFAKLVLFDIKTADSALHEAVTGRSNDTILANARRLAATGIPMVIRMPTVPTVNDRAEAVREVARIAHGLGAERMELMRFHGLGAGKALGLGMEDWCAGKEPLSDEAMLELVAVAASEGLEARIG